jgi:diguanylate cyclase (GGDEF)-like protein
MIEPAAQTRSRILVVDDEKIMQDVLRDILSDSGYEVETVENGKIALEKIDAGDYVLVFADIRMPVMDGMEFLRRARDAKPDISIIMMTGYASIDVAVEAMKLGAHDFITKPFNLEHVRLVAERAVERQELKQRAERGEYYRQLSLTDGLTELYNHRCFYQLLEIEVSRCERKGSSFSLAMIDVDNFKKYNDTLGHTEGDDILKRLAWLLKHNARLSDMVCRYGGEEFTIILTETNESASKMAAERFRRIIEEAEFQHQDAFPGGNLTISIGLATFPDDSNSGGDLVKKADAALYEAKRAGKNRLVAWRDTPAGLAEKGKKEDKKADS